MKIDIDAKSGFCSGVVYAIRKAEEELSQKIPLFCIGDIVHNTLEVKRLESLGLKTINNDELFSLRNSKILIRAHGEPPKTYQIAYKNQNSVIDASCPVVLKLQYKIRKGFEEMSQKNGQVVIFGKKGHAEVNGLVGQTEGNAIVISDEKDLVNLNFEKPIRLFSQTTRRYVDYQEIAKKIQEKMSQKNQKIDFVMYQTICQSVAQREEELRDFVKNYDVILFVSGEKSSNGQVLFNICSQENEKTYFITSIENIQLEWFQHIEKVGICGATSTPLWLMQNIKSFLQNQFF